jgi:addiction module RelE/StbE family toxin
MHLKWSAFALADRTTIFDYIEADNPRAAAAIDERIRARIMGLAQFPEMGRPGRIEGTRELVISGTPYIAAYRIDGETVRILRVLHGALHWPDQMAEESEEQSD